jgi:diguanylate cyclase (GGDEF)-like protein
LHGDPGRFRLQPNIDNNVLVSPAAPSPSSSSSAVQDPAAPNPASVERFWTFGRVALRAALAGHAVFIVLFHLFGSTLLVAANIVSVSIYAGCLALVRRRRYGTVIALVWLELLGHAALAGWVMGWDSGFHYYALILLSLVFVNPHHALPTRVTHAMLLVATYIGMDVWLRDLPPLIAVGPMAQAGMRYANIATCFVTLGLLAHFYARTVAEAERRLHAMASTDSLTGLLNRRRMLEIAGYELARNSRATQPLSMLVGDIDHFKDVNDSHGHAHGDAVLKAIARLLEDTVRREDSVARWGGEEFLLLLPGTPAAEAAAIADRIRIAVAAGDFRGTLGHPVTMTFGVSQWRPGESVDDCIARADRALYRGKKAGRNRTETAA